LLLARLSSPLKRSPVARHYLSSTQTPLWREQEGNMANIDTSDPFETSLNNVHELETFLHAFLGKLDEHKLKPGEDVTRYAKEFGLELPAVLKGANITWDGHGKPHMEAARGRVQTVVLAQPGHPDAVGLVIKCVTIRGWRVCLECGWIWCRIVVTKRF